MTVSVSRPAPRRTRLLPLLLVSALLAACGGDDSSAPEGSDGGQADTDAGSTTIVHELGATEIPSSPRTVVALDPYYSLPAALDAGADVVGSSHLQFGEPFPSFVDGAGSVEDVGWFTDLNVETIARLQPDVIVGLTSFVEPYYDRLQEIAPTVALPLDGLVWKETVGVIGEAVGKPAQAAQSLEAYETRAGELREELDAAGLAGEAVALLNIRALDDLRVYTRSCATSVLADLGLTMHLADQTEEGQPAVQLGIERLGDADASHLFYFVGSAGTNPADSEAAHDQVAAHPLWDQLDAVGADAAYPVDNEWWFGCGSVAAAELIMDDVEALLLERG